MLAKPIPEDFIKTVSKFKDGDIISSRIFPTVSLEFKSFENQDCSDVKCVEPNCASFHPYILAKPLNRTSRLDDELVDCDNPDEFFYNRLPDGLPETGDIVWRLNDVESVDAYMVTRVNSKTPLPNAYRGGIIVRNTQGIQPNDSERVVHLVKIEDREITEFFIIGCDGLPTSSTSDVYENLLFADDDDVYLFYQDALDGLLAEC